MIDFGLRVLVEICLLVLLISFLLFERDPDADKYSSSTRQTWEIIAIFSVFITALIQSLRLLYAWIIQLYQAKDAHLHKNYVVSSSDEGSKLSKTKLELINKPTSKPIQENGSKIKLFK